MDEKTENTLSSDAQANIVIKIESPKISVDLVTVLGLIFAVGVIAGAILVNQSKANFFNVPSFLIVILGTVFVTSISYSWEELSKAGKIFVQSMIRKRVNPSIMATQLMDITMLARKKGMLALSGIEKELKKDIHLADAVQIVTDGYGGEDIERVLSQNLDALVERHRRAASIARRGADVAPAMGLIGTLVGLVQMLADLQNPDSIGPAMAVALLTTFYGAILGTVVLSPIAAKLERNSNDEAMIRSLVLTAMSSIARQENPRRLEMLLNSELPPDQRINYFD
ncbi:MAG: MotA/TolQ/ExbB proton channel family protein [Rhodospirillales bacterium]|nr:MotA/TolQ/ExbB proton channel family protein [Alphaproteobacteria bacterium]USO02939.1 MAG: MotA/TolQ/ExbB proton channel family protein [Rhodospirillales bacterium]